jgi:hypothetical protein
MKVQVRHFAKVDDKCRVQYLNSTLWNQQLVQLRGKDVEILIKERTKAPSIDQRNYYRGAVLGTCFESEMFSAFDNPDQIHKEYFAPKFLSYTKIVTVGNQSKEQEFIHSMADLDRKETSDFIERVIADCAMNGITILTSEEYYMKNYQSTRE